MTDDRLLFLKDRQLGLGGSDMPRLLGLVPGVNALDVYHDKTRPLREEDTESEPIDFLRGREHEPNAREWYARHTGRRVGETHEALLHPDYPAFRGHTDGVIFPDPERKPKPGTEWSDPEAIKGEGTLELKCPRVSIFSRVYESGLRLSELVQTQTYNAIGRRSWGSLGYYSMEHDAGPLLPVDVEADPELGSFLLRTGQRFWDKHVVPRIPPEPSEWKLLEDPEAPKVRESEGRTTDVGDADLAAALLAAFEAKKLLSGAESLKDDRMRELAAVLEAKELPDRIQVPGVGKISRVVSEGRETLSKDALRGHRPIDRDKLERFLGKEAFPTLLAELELDLDRFLRRGAPFEYLRITEAKK